MKKKINEKNKKGLETSLISVISDEPKRKTLLKYYKILYTQFSIDTSQIVVGNLQAKL